MVLYRFEYSGASITFAAFPREALIHAARMARASGRELLRIRELHPVSHQLELT